MTPLFGIEVSAPNRVALVPSTESLDPLQRTAGSGDVDLRVPAVDLPPVGL